MKVVTLLRTWASSTQCVIDGGESGIFRRESWKELGFLFHGLKKSSLYSFTYSLSGFLPAMDGARTTAEVTPAVVV
jgi:hypothetical protein